MDLGNFSLSLNVADLAASRTFYETLGFTVFHGQEEAGWLILQNETCTLGLFKGMLDRNMLTFNPGWDRNAQPLANFTDIRDIQARLEAAGMAFAAKADADSKGPARLIVTDPDGNPVMLDQHV